MPLKVVRRHGSPFWYIRGTVRGIPLDESTKTSDRDAAEQIRIKREAELLERSIHGARATATFLEAAVGYMESGGDRRFIKPLLTHFGTSPLSTIDQIAVDRAAAKLYPGRAPATINRQIYTPVSAILRHGARRKLCDEPHFERPKQSAGRDRWLTRDEADRLVEAAAEHLRPLLVFLFGTGARLSEAIYLDWSQVDLSRRQAWFTKTKNGEARGVPLNSEVVAALGNLRSRDGAVFRRPDGKAYKPKFNAGGQIKTAFAGACRRAGIENFRPHDCRHTWATWFYMATRDIRALMELGGWKSERMVMRYTHVNSDHLRKQVELLARGSLGEKLRNSKGN